MWKDAVLQQHGEATEELQGVEPWKLVKTPMEPTGNKWNRQQYAFAMHRTALFLTAQIAFAHSSVFIRSDKYSFNNSFLLGYVQLALVSEKFRFHFKYALPY